MASIFMSDGTLLKASTMASPEVYNTIPNVMNITPPSRTRKTTDVYVHDQSVPITKTGAYEPMEVTFELAWDPANTYHSQLDSDQEAKTVRNYKIILPTSPTKTMSFSATVSQMQGVQADAEGTEPLKLACTLKLSGNYTIA
jgi:hypothetical protein